MRFSFTTEQNEFRKHVRQFLEDNLPPEFGFGSDEGRDDAHYFETAKLFMKKLAAAGLLVSGWPKEYGGGGRSFIEQGILAEEFGYHGVPFADSTGRMIAGPAIMHFGTEAQKARHLPEIAAGNVIWCQGFSEPNAGSDLASLVTRAHREGNEFVVNGSKVFTSRAEWADFCYLIARTDDTAPKKQMGLSVLLVDMKSPGVTVRRLPNFAHVYPQAELILDNVRVPEENLIGNEGEGWKLATTSLSFERVDMGRPAHLRRLFHRFLKLETSFDWGFTNPFKDSAIQSRIAQVSSEIEAFRLMCWEVIALQASGTLPTFEPSVCNFYGKDLIQKVSQLMMDVLGPWGLLEEGSPDAPLGGALLHQYLYSINKHGQGTAEVQRDITAKRGLLLPRL